MVLAFSWIGIGFSGIISGNYVGTVLFTSIAVFFGINLRSNNVSKEQEEKQCVNK